MPRLDPSPPQGVTVSAESNVITLGEVRIAVLTPRLLRLEWSGSGKFVDECSLVCIQRELPPVEYDYGFARGWLIIRTALLELSYKLNSGKFATGNLRVKLLNSPSTTIWKPGMQDKLNLLGTARTLDETEGEGTVNLEQGLLSRSGWTLIDDSHSPLFAKDRWVQARSNCDAQDWFFLGYGLDYISALRDWTSISGKIALPPRWTLGYWWSRYWAYSDAELRELVGEFETQKLPLNVLIIDMDWHDTRELSYRKPVRDPHGELIGWTGYSWNRDLFPSPRKLIAWLHARGIKVALNLHPASGIHPWEDEYAAFRADSGSRATKGKTIPYKLQDKQWAEAYFERIIGALKDDGVDFFWLDWQAWKDVEGIPGLNNTWWLNHTFYRFMQSRDEGRPLIFHRYGGLGNHRCPLGFSGDTWISWKSLAYLPYFTATAGNVCYGWWSHDIGGHMGKPGSGELYLRWLQYGVFSPVLRTHATKSSALERRVWMFPEYAQAMKSALLLRHKLIAYIYTQARKAYDAGISLCRPLYWFYPAREEAYHNPQEYFFGDDILAAPVTQPADANGLSGVCFWVPEGKWYDPVRGCSVEGECCYTQDYTLEEIPLLIRSGAIIPAQIGGKVHLDVYPGNEGSGELYEDDGDNDGYIEGEFVYTRYMQTRKGNKLTIKVLPREGAFHGMEEKAEYQVCVHGYLPPKGAIAQGKKTGYVCVDEFDTANAPVWTYRGGKLCTLIHIPEVYAHEGFEISLQLRPEKEQILLKGVLGVLRRLPEVMETLKTELNRVDTVANLPAIVHRYGSLATRLDYAPQNAVAELQGFHRDYPKFIEAIRKMEFCDSKLLSQAISRLSSGKYAQGNEAEPGIGMALANPEEI